MRGHVRRRGSTWSFVIDVAPDPATGRRRQRTKGGCPTREAAEELALAAGVHPKVVSDRLGHSTIAITIDT